MLKTLGVLVCLVAGTQQAWAEDITSSLVGVWKMTSFTRHDGDKVEHPYGTSPAGYLIYTRGGHYVSFFTSDDRKGPAGQTFTDAERAALLRTMVGHAGTYKVDGAKVTQLITASWNQAWTGTQRTVTYEIKGKTMTSRASLGSSKIINTFEKVE